MRDLELRGAGNLLGSQQHGQLANVGYDLYCKLMEEAVNDLRGKAGESVDIETKVELRVDAYLPANFVQESSCAWRFISALRPSKTATTGAM